MTSKVHRYDNTSVTHLSKRSIRMTDTLRSYSPTTSPNEEDAREVTDVHEELSALEAQWGLADSNGQASASLFFLARNPTVSNSSAGSVIAVFQREWPLFETVGITEAKYQLLGWPRLHPLKAAQSGEEIGPMMEAIVGLFRGADRNFADADADSTLQHGEKVMNFWADVASHARQVGQSCLALSLQSQESFCSSDASIAAKFLRRKDTLTSVHWALKMWEDDRGEHDIEDPGREGVTQTVASLAAAFAKHIDGDEEKRVLLAASDQYVEGTYTIHERYDCSTVNFPAYRCRPELAIHQVKGAPGKKAKDLSAMYQLLKSPSNDNKEIESIATAECGLGGLLGEVSVEGKLSIIDSHVIPAFVEYRDLLDELITKVLSSEEETEMGLHEVSGHIWDQSRNFAAQQ